MTRVIAVLAFALCGVCAFAQADGEAMSLVGAWNITVTPEPARNSPPFDTLHVFEFGGTTTNTGASCNAVTATPTGVRCSDGFGAWERVGNKRFAYKFILQLYNPAGQHFGFTVVRGFYQLESRDTLRGEGEVFVYIGTDLANPSQVIRLGAETAVGRRIEYTLVHEVGHMLLGPAHATSGIMWNPWGDGEIRAIYDHMLGFAMGQAAAMRAPLPPGLTGRGSAGYSTVIRREEESQ